MTTSVDISFNDDDDEKVLLNSGLPLDERILQVIRNAKKHDKTTNHRVATSTITVRPALLTSELGLSVEEATRELCGLLSAVGGGDGGANFHFERVDIMPKIMNGAKENRGTTIGTTTTTMVFTFPSDFEERAKRHRLRSNLKHKLRLLSVGFVKALKIFTAFGLILSLTVLIIIGMCLLVAAIIALARGGGSSHSGGRHRPLMHNLQYLFFQLRQILWLYAIFGSAVDGQQDPFMREIAGDIAMTMSICCGNPMHPFFWFRLGSMRTRWTTLRRSRGWGDVDGNMINGITMIQSGSWGIEDNNSENVDRHDLHYQQRGLLSIAVEFLFGPSDIPGSNHNSPISLKELEKWRFRASIIQSMSSKSPGSGLSLHELLPFVDNPPESVNDSSAIRETLRIVTYFNGKPADQHHVFGNEQQNSSGIIYGKFCFPELVAECDNRMQMNSKYSKFCPPSMLENETPRPASSILYKDDEEYVISDSLVNTDTEIPTYLYEQPFTLTELTRQQFGQCVVLGLLNFLGIVWALNAVKPDGLLSAFASMFVVKLLHVLRFYAALFFALPSCRLLIVLARNHHLQTRNKRRSNLASA